MNDLRLSIRQTYAAIGMETERAQQQMESLPGEQTIHQQPAVMNFESTAAQLTVDSSEAWQALGVGPNLDWNSRIYSQMQSIFLEGLAQQVAEGRRMMDTSNPRSAFADLAKDALFRPNPVNYQVGTPDFNNVRVHFSEAQVMTKIEPSQVEISYTPHKPTITASQGKLDIYLRQKNSIDINVISYDWYS